MTDKNTKTPISAPDDTNDPLVLEVDGLRYELDKPPQKNGKKVVARARLASGQDGSGFVDSIDLYRFRSRFQFATHVAETFGKSPDIIMGHLPLLLDQVECALAVEKKSTTVVLTDARRRAAEKLLARPDILDRVVKTLDSRGVVGETANKKRLYLTGTSRLLDRSMSALLRAQAATGKTELLDGVILLMPEEAVEVVTRLTPHAIFYAGEDALRHKLVVVDEAPGAEDAAHAIRVLQSSGRLTLAVVVKGKTERFNVYGPVSMLSGTTATSGNIENSSRCLELTLDDSPEQTKRIHEAQRALWSGEEPSTPDLQVYRDAQRLLESLPVVIPFAKRLTFPVRDTTDRRDQPKLLGLVAAHALLYQRQRRRDSKGRIVATVEDYRVAFDLYAPLIEATFEDLSQRAAQLYHLLKKDYASSSVNRREAATLTGWSYTTTRRVLDELLAHELLKVAERTTPIRYEVLEVPTAENTGLTKPDDITIE